jgi:hypothetical protein
MKIAALFFGQPRFIDNPHCYKSQSEKIFSQGSVDVFAHLWEPEGKEYNVSTWGKIHECPSSVEDVEKFISKYKPREILIEKEKDFFDADFHNRIFQKFPFTNMRNTHACFSQLYSVEKCINLFEENTEEYDWVILMRNDLCVWDFPNLSTLDKDSFYSSSLFSKDHFADLCYIFSPKYLKAFKAFSFLEENKRNQDFINSLSSPGAEQVKKLSFLSHFSYDEIKQIPIPVRVARGINSVGDQW